MKYKRLLPFSLLPLLAVFLWLGCATANSQPASPTHDTAFVGKQAADFQLEDWSGKKVSLASYRGKAVLINFWATWCAPCRIETPWLIELRNRYSADGFEILGISADDIDRDSPRRLESEKKQIARSVQQMHIPYPVLIDGQSLSGSYGGLDSLPTSFFVDRNGKIVAELEGLSSEKEIEDGIKKSLEAVK